MTIKTLIEDPVKSRQHQMANGFRKRQAKVTDWVLFPIDSRKPPPAALKNRTT